MSWNTLQKFYDDFSKGERKTKHYLYGYILHFFGRLGLGITKLRPAWSVIISTRKN